MPRQKGFTLIEVLVATAILAAVVGSVMVLIGQHARQAAALEDRLMARIAAENAMAAYVIARAERAQADLSGDIEISGHTYRFEIDRSPSPLEGFEVVTVDVRLGRDGQVLATLSTIRPGARA